MRDVLMLAVSMGRSAAQDHMLDTCTVQEVTGSTEDDATGAVVPTFGPPIYGPDVEPYRGICRFKDAAVQASTPEVGGGLSTVQRSEVQFPHDAFAPAVGLVVTGVSSATDPLRVIGRTVRVTGRPIGSQTTALRLPVEETS